MQPIISTDFIKSISQTGNQILIADQKIMDSVNIQINLPAIGIIVRNCIFNEVVVFENVDFNCGIKFVDCKFKKSLSINNCIANNYDLEFNFDGNHIEFINTQIEGLFFNGENRIERGIKICKKSIINRLQVRSLYSNKGSFAIHDSTIENQFDISLGEFSNSVEVRAQSIINTKVRFENISTGSITFTDSTFKKDIHIWAGNLGSLTFNNGVFYDDLNITAVPISSCLTIIGTEYKKSINFKLQDAANNKAGLLNEIYITSGKFVEQLIINGNNSVINDLIIDLSKQLEGALCFNSCNLLKTKLSGDNYNGNIVFNHCNFNHLSFDSFYNYSTISIISAKAYGENSEIIITHSNLGKTHFFNMFLNTFKKITIYNSILTEIITANVKWFKAQNLNPSISSNTHDFVQKKEIYRQLKYALEKQGNRIESLKFKSLEMGAFKQELFSSQKWYNKIINVDRFVLWIGQTNDFGLNWFKPTYLIIGFGLLFYCLIVVGVSEKLSYSININPESFNTTCVELRNHIYAFPQLLNPVHSLDKIFSDYKFIGFKAHFFDFSLKIFLAFFIYQIISAFRKFMK